MQKNSKILLALLGGAAAGAAVGMLFAPSTGKGSRKKISNLTNDISSKIIREAEKLLNLEQEERRRTGTGIGSGNSATTSRARNEQKEPRQN